MSAPARSTVTQGRDGWSTRRLSGTSRATLSAQSGETEPDLLEEAAWWQSDDFWQYALFAVVAYIRAAASRADMPLLQACQDLTQHHGRLAP